MYLDIIFLLMLKMKKNMMSIYQALKDYHVNHLIVAGGVAANQGIRTRLVELCEQNHITVSFPDMKYCTDNAAMIAAVGYYLYQNRKTSSLKLNSKSLFCKIIYKFS